MASPILSKPHEQWNNYRKQREVISIIEKNTQHYLKAITFALPGAAICGDCKKNKRVPCLPLRFHGQLLFYSPKNLARCKRYH
ncbi:unnamed protein product [Phytomonas sp. Hart1]|nr:unnamed protein product [Phytomonas sp. Hart1]|eukprot:CCW69799.1 unnamed protein product [Phytomonas sp. isolate Hart1]